MKIIKNTLLISLCFLLMLPFLLSAQDGAKTDKYGRNYFLVKNEPHFSTFRWIKGSRVPMYEENSEFSATLTVLGTKEFVEIVGGKLGLELTQIRVYDKTAGYIEGWTKNQFFFDKDYFGEPLEMSDQEINRRKELALKRKQDEEDRKARKQEMEKAQLQTAIISAARADSKMTIGMSFEQISNYLKKYYKEDSGYNENAVKTIKFNSKDSKWPTSLYFSMENSKVNGVHIYSNSNGFPEKQANILLYETVQEFFYSLADVKNINDNITKSSGIMEKSKMPITVKTDNSKENPFIELTIGAFTGIE